MSELKPCPFCGGKAVTSTFFDWDDLEYMAIEVNDCDAEVTCENERCINGWYLPPEAWNTRPIEDALTARIAELEAENDRLQSGWFRDETICPDGSLRPTVSQLLSRIAELEGLVDELIEAGDAMSNAQSMWVAEEDKWDALVKDWKERER